MAVRGSFSEERQFSGIDGATAALEYLILWLSRAPSGKMFQFLANEKARRITRACALSAPNHTVVRTPDALLHVLQAKMRETKGPGQLRD